MSITAAVLCCALMVSCGEKHTHGNDGHDHHAHEHEHECAHGHAHEHNQSAKLQLTAYSDKWEVYAEVSPLSMEEEAHILVHLTRMEDFKPKEKGELRVQLFSGGQCTGKTLKQPERPGIYSLHLHALRSGKAKMRFIVEGDTLEVDGLFVCEDAHTATHEAEALQITQGAAFPKEKSWKVDFATENCRKENFGQIIHSMGQVQASQNEEQLLVAPCSGIVHLAHPEIAEGRDLRKGEEVFFIDYNGLNSENTALRIQQAEIEYQRTKKAYERKKALAEKKIIPESELQSVQAEYRKAEAVYENSRKNFKGGKTGVRSPLSGHLRQCFAQNGQYVEAGEALAVVSQNRDLIIKAEVPASHYRELRNIQDALFRPMNSDEVYSLKDLDGKVISYGQSLADGGNMLPVTFRISNRADLLPGSFVETFIRTRDKGEAITVDKHALIEEMGNYFVYVQLTPELFDKREVSIGATDGKRTEIRKGLKGDERVATKGAILLKLAQASSALDAHSGHHH